MAPAPGWRVLAGGVRGSWCPHAAPPQGQDSPWQQHPPRLEVAAWTESRDVELISVTVGKPPCCKRNDGELVLRWGAEERGRGGKGTAAMVSPFPHSSPRTGSRRLATVLVPLGALVEAIWAPWGLPGRAGGRVWGSGAARVGAEPPPPWRGVERGKDTCPGHQHLQCPVSLLLLGAAGGVDVAEPPAPWRTTGTAPRDSCCARDTAPGPPSSSSPPAGSVWPTKG